jgi:leucyl aminopeptidase
MEFRYVTDPALRTTADLLAFAVLGDPARDPLFRSVDEALGGDLVEASRHESFEGKPQQTMVLWTGGRLPAKRVMVIGLGSRGDLTPASIRDAAAAAAQMSNRVGAATTAFVVPALGNRVAEAVQYVVEGATQGLYKFSRYLTADDAKKTPSLQRFAILTDAKGKKLPAAQARQLGESIERGEVIARAVCTARDLVNEPAGTLTPAQLAAEAEAIAAKHKSLSIKVLGPAECAELGMGMFLAVAQGSDQEARFIHMTYRPAGAKKSAKGGKGKAKGTGPKKVCLVGKGLTFDSGGYSLKPSNAMEDMKIDMAGSAAVIAAMDAIATLGSEYEVHAVAAICENLVSGRAYKLGDVLKSMDGTTVEINNTDAEGRLTLGDAITYARTKIQPDELFDFATLTGACMVALGPYTAGVMGDNDRLVNSWLSAAGRAGEEMWRLPLLPRLREQLKSPIADLRNTGDRFGGAITAGLFLKTFVKDTPWVHVDLAGPAAVTGGGRASQPRGATGFGVATIVEYLCGA